MKVILCLIVVFDPDTCISQCRNYPSCFIGTRLYAYICFMHTVTIDTERVILKSHKMETGFCCLLLLLVSCENQPMATQFHRIPGVVSGDCLNSK